MTIYPISISDKNEKEENLLTVDFSKIATNLIEDGAKSLWQKVKKYFKDIGAKESVELGIAFDEYILRTRSKYSKIKTIINSHTPVDLYKYYVSIGVSYYNGESEELVDTSNVNNLTAISNRIVITGLGGIGKSTLLKHLFLSSIANSEKIPIMIELRGLNSINELVFEKIIYNTLKMFGFELEEEYFVYSLKLGAYTFLFDGFDEVNKEKADTISREIKRLSSQYNQNNYIISSRPSERFIDWNDFTQMESQNLSLDQAVELINKIDLSFDIKENFINELRDSFFEKYNSFASNPLLLTIMVLTYESNALLPDKINDFYSEAFSTLFNKHDATKDCFVRNISSGLDISDFKEIFGFFCLKSYLKHEYEFTDSSLIEYITESQQHCCIVNFNAADFQMDLIQSVCMLIKDGLKYTFTHRSFQEYFAAWYTNKLTDQQQQVLLPKLLNESGHELYFELLSNFQKDRTNQNALLPALIKLEAEYNKHGFSLEFISLFFSEVLPSRSGTGVLFLARGGYYFNVVEVCSSVNNYIWQEESAKDIEKTLYEKIRQKYKLDSTSVRSITIEELDDFMSQSEIKRLFEFWHKKIQFCLSLKDKLNSGSKDEFQEFINSL